MASHPSRPPTRVKPNEVAYLNPGWTDITYCHENGTDIPEFAPGEMYLWVLTGDDHLVIGIENAWKQPGALKEHALEAGISKYLEAKGKAGHPTLTPKWNKDGSISDEPGQAAIGGELNYVSGQWVIDNNSGRYGSATAGVRKRNLMNRAALKFRSEANLNIQLVKTYSKNVIKRWFRQTRLGSWGFGRQVTGQL